MTLLTKLATAAAFAALLGFSTPSHAQGKRSSKSKATTSTKAKKATKVKPKTTRPPKTKDYDFMADEIDGDRPLPNLDNVTGIIGSKHASLIRLRQHFIPEIIRSADML